MRERISCCFERHQFLERRICLTQLMGEPSLTPHHKTVDNLEPAVENVAFTCLLLQ
jgi:hypothetical protein